MRTNIKDQVLKYLIYLATGITIGILVWIIGFIFVNGASKINWRFFTSAYDEEVQYVDVEIMEGATSSEDGYISNIGITVDFNDAGELVILSVDKGSTANSAKNRLDERFGLEEGDIITKIGSVKVTDQTLNEIQRIFQEEASSVINLKVERSGGGVFPMIITTLYMIVISLAIAAPIGILAAIYLTEYAKAGRLVSLIRFATESLSGIPSIIYGLFGMIFFVVTLQLGYSILAGALTLSIILLPTIIRTTEESLKAVPESFREGSLGLGATKFQTIRKVILPSAIPGILVAVILSIGRIVGESAALLLTAGTVAKIPASITSGGASLTVKAYMVAKEEGNIEMACAIGTVVILLIIILNLFSRWLSKKLDRATIR